MGRFGFFFLGFSFPPARRLPEKIISFNANAHVHQQAGSYYLAMGLSKKRKQQLSYVTTRSLESRKVDYKNQRKKEILRRQRQEEGYWDEYEDYNSEPSSDESDCNEPIPDEPSFMRKRRSDKKQQKRNGYA